MRRRTLFTVLGAVTAVLLLIVVLGIVASRARVRRHRVFRPAPATAAVTSTTNLAPQQWTAAFRTLQPQQLADLLSAIETRHPQLYKRYRLGYLHARALLEDDEDDDAEKKLASFLAPGEPFRDLALYHQSEIADDREDHAAASRARQSLIYEYPRTPYRAQAIEEETEYLASRGDLGALKALATKIGASATTRQRRDLAARAAVLRLTKDASRAALDEAFSVLKSSHTDDAAERVARTLDNARFFASMTAEERALLGEALQSHRHYDRAIVHLTAAAAGLPLRRDDLLFAIGRCHFGAERYADAERTYLRAAPAAKEPRAKSTFYFHASRAAQLRGDDAAAERAMTAAIAVPGLFPSTTAASTQRLRTRLKHRRPAEAAADLAFIRKNAAKDRAHIEAALAYAIGSLGTGQSTTAATTLVTVPPALLDKYDKAEFDYWRARAVAGRDPSAAFPLYLSVLRNPTPSHFAYLTRKRLTEAPMAQHVAAAIRTRQAQVKNLVAARQWDLARELQTDVLLLRATPSPQDIALLRQIYMELPVYRAIIELKPSTFPTLPNVNPEDRTALLMALGLFDEAAESIPDRYSLQTPKEALTQALALHYGAASRESIYAVEVLMKQVPRDFHPDLLPLELRQLLYPRYFLDTIQSDSKAYGADPDLVLSIMREESRFDPRAKSEAAARGLLQFIITTARDIGRDVGIVEISAEDLYDPRVIIRLGAKYIAELTERFGNDRYKATAAYNAGEHQVALWSRLAPASGADYFLSSINFDETKHYVRKVMNSYERYGEIYRGGAPRGGVAIEP